MECPFTTINENTETIDKTLENSKKIAIIGLSPDVDKASNMVARYLIEQGYTIFPIYPKGDEILGRKVYRSLSEIEENVDIVNVFRKGDALPAVLDEVLKIGGIPCIWAQLGVVHDETALKAKERGLVFIQNKCIKIEHQRLRSK